MLWRSDWSLKLEDLAQQALTWHLGSYVEWLFSAGAEPRLALILISQGAKQRFFGQLAEEGVELVHTPATLTKPLHPLIQNHQGDHFNRRLFVVDGFETGEPGVIWAALERSRDQLRRTATWVALLIESPSSLESFEQQAPQLQKLLQWRCLALSPELPQHPALLPEHRHRWRRNRRFAELCFHSAMTRAEPAIEDFGRLVRSGYATCLPPCKGSWGALQRFWAGEPVEAEGPVLARALALRMPQPDPNELPLREAPRLRAELGMEVPEDPQLQALSRLIREARGEAVPRAVLPEGDPEIRALGALALAAIRAQEGDLEGFSEALSSAEAAAPDAAPELHFEILEKSLSLAAFQGDRSRGRQHLDSLAKLWHQLQSPYFHARFLLARAEWTAPLDPQRAASDFEAAEGLFKALGYPDWVEQVQDRR